jgi:addiction module RelB/DinJ family antitoxin
MNTMVTARVPQEIKNQGDLILKNMGASVTELINAAYEYVIKTSSLPSAPKQIGSKNRTITHEMFEALKSDYENMSIDCASSLGSASYKELKSAMWEDRNARFS